MHKKSVLILAVFLGIYIGCARPPADKPLERRPEYSMRVTEAPANLVDDMNMERLSEAITKNVERLQQLDIESLEFGPRIVPKDEYILSLQHLGKTIDDRTSDVEVYDYIISNFNFYEVQGKDQWGQVFITSYYEPVIPGSRNKTKIFSQPLYGVPDNLVKIHMDKFVDSFERLSPLEDQINSGNTNLYGRLIETQWGTRYSVVPYYTREEIDRAEVLAKKDLELAWVDPVDAFFLHIQGSGTVKLMDGTELRVGYGSQNGHPYSAIGKYLYSVIPPERMSKQAIENYLRSIPEIDMKHILYKNKSYIFFTELNGRPVTSFGTEVVDGRTIATDRIYYPKGALAYLKFEKPVFDDDLSIEPAEWEKTSRFVLDQDTGGAISGPHRVDLFWGKGEEAERHAGVMKNRGELYYLVPKKEFIERISDNGSKAGIKQDPG